MSRDQVGMARWRTCILLSVVVGSAACAAPGNGGGHDQPSDELAVANITQAVERDGPGDRRPDFCQDFRLTVEQIDVFLTNASEVDAIQIHEGMWLPCLVVADVDQGGLTFKATIAASFVAWLSYPGVAGVAGVATRLALRRSRMTGPGSGVVSSQGAHGGQRGGGASGGSTCSSERVGGSSLG